MTDTANTTSPPRSLLERLASRRDGLLRPVGNPVTAADAQLAADVALLSEAIGAIESLHNALTVANDCYRTMAPGGEVSTYRHYASITQDEVQDCADSWSGQGRLDRHVSIWLADHDFVFDVSLTLEANREAFDGIVSQARDNVDWDQIEERA